MLFCSFVQLLVILIFGPLVYPPIPSTLSSFVHPLIFSALWLIRSYAHRFNIGLFVHPLFLSLASSFVHLLILSLVRSPIPHWLICSLVVSQCIVASLFHPNRFYYVLAAPPPHGSADGHTPGSPRPVNVTMPTPPAGGPE